VVPGEAVHDNLDDIIVDDSEVIDSIADLPALLGLR
jgi:hypothetical protein